MTGGLRQGMIGKDKSMVYLPELSELKPSGSQKLVGIIARRLQFLKPARRSRIGCAGESR